MGASVVMLISDFITLKREILSLKTVKRQSACLKKRVTGQVAIYFFLYICANQICKHLCRIGL